MHPIYSHRVKKKEIGFFVLSSPGCHVHGGDRNISFPAGSRCLQLMGKLFHPSLTVVVKTTELI